MKSLTVLTTACGAMFMPGFFRCLKENGERKIRIVGVDISQDPIKDSFLDAYYTVPRINDPLYVEVLLKICRAEKVDIFFPQISMELDIILQRVDEFKKIGVMVAISEEKTLKIANSKYKLYEYMREHKLAVPKYHRVQSVEDFCLGASLLGYPEVPVCVKVSESSGSRGVRIVMSDLSKSDIFLNSKPTSIYTTMEDMVDTLQELRVFPEMMVMEYLPGCEYTVDLLADHGKVLYIAGRRNTKSQASIAMESIVERKDEAYELCERIVSILKLDGNIGFDFMLDEKDKPILTDLNPRITATIVIYLAAGVNFPYLRVKQLLGEELPQIEIKYGAKLVRKYLDTLYND